MRVTDVICNTSVNEIPKTLTSNNIHPIKITASDRFYKCIAVSCILYLNL